MPAVTGSRTFALLTPAVALVPASFHDVHLDENAYLSRLGKLQRLRGALYLEDGAIEPWQLTEDGRHHIDADEASWHLLSMRDDEAIGCARLQVYDPNVSFDTLNVAQAALSEHPTWGPALRDSVTAELRRARDENLSFVEAGGWALAPELRFTTEALNIALASYAIGELLGGCLGLSTATVRHHSSSILRRLGGSSFTWEGWSLPPYYDPAYRCEMEIVKFDSRQPNAKYRGLVEQLKAELPSTPVMCRTAGTTISRHSMSVVHI